MRLALVFARRLDDSLLQSRFGFDPQMRSFQIPAPIAPPLSIVVQLATTVIQLHQVTLSAQSQLLFSHPRVLLETLTQEEGK
jgi:hypothetical protein